MGYTTKFIGHINLTRKLTMAEARQLLEFNEDPDRIEDTEHPTRSYLQWVPSETLDALVWDEGEKFYDYEQWLQWILRWLADRGVRASGQLDWRGEDGSDIGRITVADSAVTVEKGAATAPSGHKPMTLSKLALLALDAATSA